MQRPGSRGRLLLPLLRQRCCASHHPAARCEGGGGGLSAVFGGGGGGGGGDGRRSVRSTHTHSSREWSVGAELDGAGDAVSLSMRTDRDAAQRLRDKYKRSALAQQTPQVVTGDRGKLRAFVRMLREVEEMREQGWTIGPLTYAVAISVCNSVLTVTHRPDDECEADGGGDNSGGGKSSILLAAERLYGDFRRDWGGKRQGPRWAKERVYSAIMHSYIRGGRGADCVRVLREDMPAAGVAPTASHYGLAVGALGRLGEPDAAFRLVAAVQAEGRVDVATVGVLRALVGACTTHAAAKRAVLQFARLGVGVDAHVARAYVQVNLREAGLRSSWGLDEARCVAAALAPAARATLGRNVRSCREYVERVGVRRTGLLTACYMHAHAVGGRYREALDEVGLGAAAEGGDAAAVRRLQETVCEGGSGGGGGAFYVYSTLMFVCAQACFADDRSRDWVRLAERVFRKAEVARVGGLSAVFHTRLMTVYAAARDGERASLLLLHMRQAEARVRPSPAILRCWRVATRREEAG